MSFISFLILLDWLGSVQCCLEVVGVDILTLFPISGQLSVSPSDIMLAIGFFLNTSLFLKSNDYSSCHAIGGCKRLFLNETHSYNLPPWTNENPASE